MASVKGDLHSQNARFWSKVQKGKPLECWLWTGAKKPHGYGNIRRDKKYTTAHRVSWEIAFGDIPKGMQVQHSCDNPSCCNPHHLMLGTVMSNFVDMVKKGRSKVDHKNRLHGENHPKHKLTSSQVDEIRSTYKFGVIRQKDLAANYGVSQPLIGVILRNEGRNHG